MIRPLLLHNDQIRPSSALCFSPGQVGVMNGWGVFSTIKIVDGVLFAFHRHWARMRRDAELLRVPFPYSEAALEALLLRLVEANADYNATLRVAVVRNTGTLFEGPGIASPHDLVAFIAPTKDWGAAVRLGVVPHARHAASRFAGAKITAWATNLVCYEEAQQRGFDEVVLLNEHGMVSECTSANIFAAFGNEVRTPPLSSGCLPGVTRQLLVEGVVHASPYHVVERDLSLDCLAQADGVFITSSTRDLLPVSAIESVSVQQDRSACAALASAFGDYVRRYAREAARRATGAATLAVSRSSGID